MLKLSNIANEEWNYISEMNSGITVVSWDPLTERNNIGQDRDKDMDK